MARPPIIVGNHKYSGTDAHRTLLSVGSLWRHHLHDVVRDPNRVATVGAELAQSLESLTGLRSDKNLHHELGAKARNAKLNRKALCLEIQRAAAS